MRTSTVVWIIVILLVIIGGGWYLFSGMPSAGSANVVGSQVTDNTGQTGTQSKTGSSTQSAPMQATVTYTDNGFSPQSVTVAQGGTVTFVDNSTGGMWVASNPHPVHTDYDGTSAQQHCAQGYNGPAPFDQCKKGQTFSFTFDKTGSFGYHNHANHAMGGTVAVQ